MLESGVEGRVLSNSTNLGVRLHFLIYSSTTSNFVLLLPMSYLAVQILTALNFRSKIGTVWGGILVHIAYQTV